MDRLKHWIDAASISAAFTALFGWLPTVLSVLASFMSIVWLGMQMRDRAARKRKEADGL